MTLSRSPRDRAHRASRAPMRGLRGGSRTHDLAQKRAAKQAALRDCGRRCVYCGTPLDYDGATLDHVYPRAHGGPSAPGNLVAACGRCNRLKGDMLPQEFFARHPWAGLNFMHYARTVHRALKRSARRAVSLACAA